MLKHQASRSYRHDTILHCTCKGWSVFIHMANVGASRSCDCLCLRIGIPFILQAPTCTFLRSTGATCCLRRLGFSHIFERRQRTCRAKSIVPLTEHQCSVISIATDSATGAGFCRLDKRNFLIIKPSQQRSPTASYIRAWLTFWYTVLKVYPIGGDEYRSVRYLWVDKNRPP